MTERRAPTDTGSDSTFSFGADNVERGEPGADFVKRKPTFPIGDDPRGRELDYRNAGPDNPEESYGAKNMMYRAFRGQAPLDGQDYGEPKRAGKLQRITELRPEQPSRTVDAVALDLAKEEERLRLATSEFFALYPETHIILPAPGASVSPGSTLQIHASSSYSGLRGGIQRAVLSIDGSLVDSVVLPRSEQDSNQSQEWYFYYQIPADRPIGAMEITVRAFTLSNSFRGLIADDSVNSLPYTEDVMTGLGTLDGRPGSATSASDYQSLLGVTSVLRHDNGSTSITVNVT